MKPLAQLVRPNILALQPYSTARDEYAGGGIDVWLDANESPYDNGVNRYPDPHQRALKALIAELKDVDAGRIFLGNGSDEAIDLAFRIFCRPGLDNAVSIAAARTKGIVSEVAGRADILVVPDLESGNMLAKQLEYLAGASGSGIVLGARVPIALTSRADGPTARVASALLAVLVAYDARRVRAPKAAAPIKD